MLKSKLAHFMVLLQLWTLSLSTNVSSCVDNYLDLEEQTFGNNSENRVKLYQVFYPPNDHFPYSVVVTYQAALPNGTEVNISTDPSCPDRLVWQWLSSPVLFLLDPITLNSRAFYTLNHFTEWVPPHLTIVTPLPCSAKVEELLTLMTTSVSSTMNIQCVHLNTLRRFLLCSKKFTSCMLFLISPASGIFFGRDVKGRAHGIFQPRVCHKHRHCFSKRCKFRCSCTIALLA